MVASIIEKRAIKPVLPINFTQTSTAMIPLFETLGIFGTALVLIAAVLLTMWVMKSYLRHETKEIILHHEAHPVGWLTKKHPEVDISQYKGLIRNLGIIFSLLIVITVFEFPTFEKEELVDLGQIEAETEEFVEIPPTEQKAPPPPTIKSPEIIAVADEEIIEEEIEIDLDLEFDEDVVVEEITETTVEATEVEEEEVEEIFTIVEEPASPVGGLAGFYQYIGNNIKYPDIAKRLKVEGKVFVKFVVDKDGSLTQLEVVKGIGSGCDKEAIRVLKDAPKWTPGRQRGRAVRQYMVIPINFILQD